MKATALTFCRFLSDVLRISGLSRAQLTYCQVVFDRVSPRDLNDTDRALARQIFGAVDIVPANASHTVACLKGARVGGTWLHSLFLLYRALTADLSRLAGGEHGFGVIVAERLALARQALRYVKGAAHSVPAIEAMITAETTDLLTLRRQDGHTVTIECAPAARGGSAARGKSYFAALLDEACFFRDADTGVVNDTEVFRAIAPRVMAGGMIAVVSTAWTETGLLWTLVQQNHGNPTTALAAICPTLLMRDDEKIRADYEIALATDPENCRREFDCEPLTQGTGLFFDPSTIKAAIDRSLPLVTLPRATDEAIIIGVGVDTGLISDSSAGVACHRSGELYTLAEFVEMRPAKGAPLKLSEVCKTYAELMGRHNTASALADGHELEPSREHLEPLGCTLEAAPAGNSGNFEIYSGARQLLNEGQLRIPGGWDKFTRQLREVCCKPLPGGLLKIWQPRGKGGHGDLVSAAVLAVYQARLVEANPWCWEDSRHLSQLASELMYSDGW